MPPETTLAGPTAEQGLIALASLGIHLTYFYLIKAFVPFIGKNPRNLSWVLTLVTAIVVTFGGIYISSLHCRTILSDPIPYENYSHVPGSGFYRYDITSRSTLAKVQDQEPMSGRTLRHFDTVSLDRSLVQASILEQEKLATEVATREEMVKFYQEYDRIQQLKPWYKRRLLIDSRFQPSDSWIGQLVTIFFGMYLVADILCGLLHYKKHVSLLAGWIHHTAYVCIAYYTVVVAKEGHTYAAYLIIEIPTVVIGFGYLHKPLRNDMLFGASYIAFRLIFDFLQTQEYITARPEMSTSIKVIILMKFLLNAKFFSDWINQQIRLRKRNARASLLQANEIVATITPNVVTEKSRLSEETAALELYTIDTRELEDEEHKVVLDALPMLVERKKQQMQGERVATKRVIVSTASVEESVISSTDLGLSKSTAPRRRATRRSKAAQIPTTPNNPFMEDHPAQESIAVR
ncbi:hypothetical protein BGZ83_005203 [Gryganskiella cystojenkinii]|nr:hypothetical protein BGZ83_005203 [Gryganskiella cystojenkinii]